MLVARDRSLAGLRALSAFGADLLVLDRNPLQDIGAYQDVLLVMTDGRIVIDRTAF